MEVGAGGALDAYMYMPILSATAVLGGFIQRMTYGSREALRVVRILGRADATSHAGSWASEPNTTALTPHRSLLCERKRDECSEGSEGGRELHVESSTGARWPVVGRIVVEAILPPSVL